MSRFANAEIFAATTLLVVLGTSFLTSLAGLSLALGAFLAGLLIAETEYALQASFKPESGHCQALFGVEGRWFEATRLLGVWYWVTWGSVPGTG